MFRRKKSIEDPIEQISRKEQREMEDQARWQTYVDHAQSLPLLSDEELHLFALNGDYNTYRSPLGNTFYCDQVPTQFMIRLRRTLLARENQPES